MNNAIIYNVTTKVDTSIATQWLQWMQEVHIPAILDTGCFTGYKLVRLLEVDDSEGPTYATQYFAESKADYNRYIELYAAALRKDSYDRWGQQFIAFRSLMEVVK
ncbi:MAG TPA: DUF4286 family protein [Flavisolibacter sp.]|jgi:hypothetical protein|nr:DUF4286 family protein [Flavisolibacter sp.]